MNSLKLSTLKVAYNSLDIRERLEFDKHVKESNTCWICREVDLEHLRVCTDCKELTPKCLLGDRHKICIRCGTQKSSKLCTCTGSWRLILSNERYCFGEGESSVVEIYKIHQFCQWWWCNGNELNSETIRGLLEQIVKFSSERGHPLPPNTQLHRIVNWLE